MREYRIPPDNTSSRSFLWRCVLVLVAVVATIVVVTPPHSGMFADKEVRPDTYRSCEVVEETETGAFLRCLK